MNSLAMSAPGAEGGDMGFPAGDGVALAASALRDDVLAARSSSVGDGDGSASSNDPQLPPLRLPCCYGAFGSGLASPGSNSSSDAFVSMRSTPSGLLNPYGLWSPGRAPSEASSSEMQFGTARDYDTTDLFFRENWLYGDHLFHGKPASDKSDDGDGVDKFIIGPDVNSRRSEMCEPGDGGGCRHVQGNADSEGCAEVYTCSSPPCGCCYGQMKNDEELVRDSCSAVYGRYQIMDDQTEVLDECGSDAFRC